MKILFLFCIIFFLNLKGKGGAYKSKIYQNLNSIDSIFLNIYIFNIFLLYKIIFITI